MKIVKRRLKRPLNEASSDSMTRLTIYLAASLVAVVVSAPAAEDRRERVLNDRKEIEASGQWIYNDLPKGFAEAARTRRPMLVVFRCIP